MNRLMSLVLSVSGLYKAYNGLVAVNGVSFMVNRSEIVGLLGPNGAGKTTTINMVLGVLAPGSGSVTIEGFSLAKERSQAMACTRPCRGI
jgi:ABC-2 type transport system ATP-binding protein